MTGRRGFICGGCWTLDHIKLIDVWPPQEGLARILDTGRQGGGSGHNLAVDMRKLDSTMPVDAIGLVGNDGDGDFLLQNAHHHGINTDQLRRTEDHETSYTDVMSVISTGKRTFFHHMGANDAISPDDFDFTATQRRVLHLGLLGLHKTLDNPWQNDPNGWVTILKKAQSAGLQTNIEMVSIEASRIQSIGRPCLPYLDTLIINDEEIGGLTGTSTVCNGKTDVQACENAALAALEMGSMHLVVVHFPLGAVCVTRKGQIVHSTSIEVPTEAIGSTVGAGDAFAAGMLYALHEAWPIPQSLQLAHAVAAASLGSSTTVDSVVSVQECLAMAGITHALVDA